jgi:hypothetical protein
VLRRLGLGLSIQQALTMCIAGLSGCFNILLTMSGTEAVRDTPVAFSHRPTHSIERNVALIKKKIFFCLSPNIFHLSQNSNPFYRAQCSVYVISFVVK